MPGVFENILGIPSERVKRNEDGIASPNSSAHQFVAVALNPPNEETITGTAGLHVYENHRLRDSGTVGIMVHKDYQNKGVGTALMNALMDIANSWLMLVRVELTVFSDNEKAVHLYEKFGFVQEGVKRLAAIRNGKYENEILMARINLPIIEEGCGDE